MDPASERDHIFLVDFREKSGLTSVGGRRTDSTLVDIGITDGMAGAYMVFFCNRCVDHLRWQWQEKLSVQPQAQS
ncbi:uncharacterized protein N7500_004000 [Penicillium coprophilum]|uniref:uncharacterized protein n=1 Tax=Penicillium coprophilum TaxID=36646 RepID=UPI0023A7007B|nr:uncharacterized protein N7500_004000 [Penicillium coprophilum]KAJ5171217.1 hypothetical protein N7500_004000 [Penicillium coprophilum]